MIVPPPTQAMPGDPPRATEDSPSRVPLQGGENERVLCQHCRRTASNGIRCLGMCVADSDY
ncbi:hypothetical protein [Synechococcus sp. MIT S1220]|uniref:hypothetical protein n=1 Tax=Synechococcus sp. MIT S1220 TaxID=3082549 RepID=UPI0039AF1B88